MPGDAPNPQSPLAGEVEPFAVTHITRRQIDPAKGRPGIRRILAEPEP